jgi:hypothetical protein
MEWSFLLRGSDAGMGVLKEDDVDDTESSSSGDSGEEAKFVDPGRTREVKPDWLEDLAWDKLDVLAR